MPHFDLCIIGSGSGNTIRDERFGELADRDGRGRHFGGTCLNVGCIPTKMYVYPADLALIPEHARRLGVDLSWRRFTGRDPRPHLRPDRPRRQPRASGHGRRDP